MSITRDKQVVNLRGTGLSNAEIGRRLGLSRERVRQIIKGESAVKRKPSNNPDVLLTTGQAGELLNVHVNTVRRWSNMGILETYRIGPRRDRRFRRQDIDNFLLRKPAYDTSQSRSQINGQ